MMRQQKDVGLCFTCHWKREVTTKRGSVFYRCARAETDPRFPRYPPLPRLACEGYEEDRPDYLEKTPTP